MTNAPAFNPVLLDIPDRLETARLDLRAPRPGDGEMLFASVQESLESLRRFPASMTWAVGEQTAAQAEDFCRRSAANWILRTDFPFLLFLRETGEHVGNCGLHRFDWETRVFEIGWWGRSRFQGRGYVTEAAAAITGFAFGALGARRVWCFSDELNERSWRVAERLGFRHEGTLVSERGDPDGTRRNMRLYAATR